ncbi:MAG: DUF3737 family protein [Fibrobacteraceae bacterium]|nr:DUF3737 family protein [Fibrobacteraceae bacterium]
MNEAKQQILTGERALYQSRNLKVVDCVFEDGESPLKESSDIEVLGSIFKWRYPLWYCKNVTIKDSDFFEGCRAGMWYTQHMFLENSIIKSPKNFRLCKDLTLKNVQFTDGPETLWKCSQVRLENVYAKGDYFAMDCSHMDIENFNLDGKYSFDGVKNVTIRNARMLTKDAFWNSENVTVYDSFISAEYLGWNAKNLTFVNCTIESLQGLCYVENLVLKNCKLINTTLAFEYSTVDVHVVSSINSVKNPSGGIIRCASIGELIMEKDKVDVSKTKFETL